VVLRTPGRRASSTREGDLSHTPGNYVGHRGEEADPAGKETLFVCLWPTRGPAAIWSIASQLRRGKRRVTQSTMCDPERRNVLPLTVYQVVPAPCTQHNILFPHLDIKNEIDDDGEDAKLDYTLYQRRAFSGYIKNLLRPIYRSIYLLALRFKGKRTDQMPVNLDLAASSCSGWRSQLLHTGAVVRK
jgi:hypothetical protein